MTDAHYSFTLEDAAKLIALLIAYVAVCSAPFITAMRWGLKMRWRWAVLLGVICGILAFVSAGILLHQ